MKKTPVLLTLLAAFLLTISGSVEAAELSDPNIVPAEIKITPQTLNLKSNGNWVNCRIKLPEDYNVANVLPDSILMEYDVEASWQWFDKDEQVLMVKFDRSKLQCDLIPTDSVELIVTGDLSDGKTFEGTDTIKVVGPEVAPFAITGFKIKQGRRTGGDVLTIKGTINVGCGEIDDANSIDIELWSVDDVNEPTYSALIPFNPDDVKNRKYKHKNKQKQDGSNVDVFRIDMKKRTFSIRVKNVDLGDLVNPVTLVIDIGLFSGTAEWPN